MKKEKPIFTNSEENIRLPDGKVVKASELNPGQLLYAGTFLTIYFFRKAGGQARYLIEGKLPKTTREPGEPARFRHYRDTFELAKMYLQTRELAAQGLTIKAELKATELETPWLRKFESAFLQLKDAGPEIVSKVVKFYVDNHSIKDLNNPISLRTLLTKLVAARGGTPEDTQAIVPIVPNNSKSTKSKQPKGFKRKRKRARATISGWIAAVNTFTRLCGKPCGMTNRFGRPLYDMPAADITEQELLKLDEHFRCSSAISYIRRISAVLQFGVNRGYLEKNVARGIELEQDHSSEAPDNVPILSLESIQLGLNMAARIYHGKMLPLFVLYVAGGLRPMAEIPFFKWDRVAWQPSVISVYSSKTKRTRLVELSPNWMAILRWAFDNGIEPMSSVPAWGAIRMIMGYKALNCPASLQPPNFETFKAWVQDICRHTACSYQFRYAPMLGENARWAGNTPEVFSKHYANGMITKEMAAQFYSMLPDTMKRTEELDKAIHKDLVAHQLLNPESPLPESPKVANIHLKTPTPIVVPTLPDRELEQQIWDTSLEAVGAKLNLGRSWLTGYCLAKQIKLPPQCNKRENRVKLQDVPTPPPLVKLSNDELRKRIWEAMSIAPVARELGIYPTWLRIYCIVHKIDYPDRRRFARQKGLASAKNSFLVPPDKIVKMFTKRAYPEVAKKLGITTDKLLTYCRKHNITVPGYTYFKRAGQYSLQIEQPTQPIAPISEQTIVVSTIPPTQPKLEVDAPELVA